MNLAAKTCKSTLLALSFFLIAGVCFADNTDTLNGIEVGFTEAGHPYKGDPAAPVTLIEYSDYLCPYCARYFSATMPELVEKYVKPGKMRMEFRHFPIPALHPTAAKGHEATACAGEQGAVAFWQLYQELFKRQGEWNRLPDPGDFLHGVAKEVGLDMPAYDSCIEQGGQAASVNEAMATAKDLGFNGTPTFQIVSASEPDEAHTIVGARPTAYFSQYIDALLAGKAPPKEPEQPKPELPVWAKTDALAVDPDRAGFTVGGDPYRGDINARLVIVEFTDFQCPACARHAIGTQPAIDEQLINTGKVRWVSKSLPLREHANAPAAAVAAECAGDQQRYWEMHVALFEDQDNWAAQDEPDAALLKLAAALDLQMDDFAECLGSRKALERVLQDIYDAATVTRRTPTFVLLHGETGRTLRGTQSPEQFIKIVQQQLDSILESDDQKSADNIIQGN